jgi:hypothetical protein
MLPAHWSPVGRPKIGLCGQMWVIKSSNHLIAQFVKPFVAQPPT